MTTEEKFEGWAILEIMGHQRFAGHISSQTVGGQSFVRLDVPEVDEHTPAFSKLFGGSSVYCITPVSEEVARLSAEGMKRSPLNVYDLPDEARRKLTQAAISYDTGSEDYDDGEPF